MTGEGIDEAAALVVETRDAIRRILHGRDRERLLIIVGPCSIHDTKAAIDYAERLEPLARRYADHLIVIMRTYFEKPRTSVGWQGASGLPKYSSTFARNASRPMVWIVYLSRAVLRSARLP